MSTPQPELIFNPKSQLGEGAIWHARQHVLYWVDILGKKFWQSNPATGHHEDFEIGQFVGTIVPRHHGGVMLALHHGFAVYYPHTLKLTLLCDPENNQPALRFNDGKCDPAGRFWAGTMPVAGSEPLGNLYCLFPDHRVERKLTGIGCSNGIVWSLDHKTMYFIDTRLQRVDAFDYDLATAHIGNRRVAFAVPKELGYPDGSTLDADGMLWIAHWGGACVTRWNPATGQHLATVKFPTPQITSCAFGGPKLDQLYVTSARIGQETDPLAGALFCVDVGVKGIPANEFAS
ncbi:MAG: 6-deoxy-6-sulfogluconolactonase [Verrucomicrobiae bacterium]|nr:6-deoxy-6-sulfogluconolactonase [Verrucomicrobiae bacterium]